LKGATDNAERLSLFGLVTRGPILPFQPFSHVITDLVVKGKHHIVTVEKYFKKGLKAFRTGNEKKVV
jgi:hypothetical protein